MCGYGSICLVVGSGIYNFLHVFCFLSLLSCFFCFCFFFLLIVTEIEQREKRSHWSVCVCGRERERVLRRKGDRGVWGGKKGAGPTALAVEKRPRFRQRYNLADWPSLPILSTLNYLTGLCDFDSNQFCPNLPLFFFLRKTPPHKGKEWDKKKGTYNTTHTDTPTQKKKQNYVG